jgi:hypothetical protein
MKVRHPAVRGPSTYNPIFHSHLTLLMPLQPALGMGIAPFRRVVFFCLKSKNEGKADSHHFPSWGYLILHIIIFDMQGPRHIGSLG